MRILIDCVGVARRKAGVGVYARNLVDELTRVRSEHQYFILVQNDDPDLDFGSRAHVRMIRVHARLFRSFPLRFLLEQFFIPCLCLIHRIDVLHSLHYAFPLLRFGTKKVVTLHDMTFLTMPEAHERIKTRYFGFFIRADVRFADKVIFVSQSAASDCAHLVGSPRSSAVIYHGKSGAYHTDYAEADLRQVRNKYGLHHDFVLFVGTIEPRKNLANLVAAFASMCDAHPGLQLVIAGMQGWLQDDLGDTVQRFNLQSRVIFTGFVLEEEKPLLMAAASVFAYPSRYEGFGIPVLEALACGIPTVTSNVSSLPEVAGDAALKIDPDDVNEMSRALESAFSDGEVRALLRSKSVVQAAKFTWVNTAAMTVRAYQDVLRPKLSGHDA